MNWVSGSKRKLDFDYLLEVNDKAKERLSKLSCFLHENGLVLKTDFVREGSEIVGMKFSILFDPVSDCHVEPEEMLEIFVKETTDGSLSVDEFDLIN